MEDTGNMVNIIDICKEFGFEVPADKEKDFTKKVAENYKTVVEHDKVVEKLTLERDTAQADLNTANETIEKFKDIDPDKMAEEIQNYKDELERKDNEYKAELEKRDYNDAIDKLLADVKFSSEAAKKSFKHDLIENPLQLRNGAVLGFDEVLKQAKESDPTAFVDEKTEEAEKNRAKFTTGMNNGSDGSGSGTGKMTKDEILEMRDSEAQQRAIRENIGLFVNTNN